MSLYVGGQKVAPSKIIERDIYTHNGVPAIGNVTLEQRRNSGEIDDETSGYEEQFRGNYAGILFTVDATKEYIEKNYNNLFFTIDRYKKAKERLRGYEDVEDPDTGEVERLERDVSEHILKFKRQNDNRYPVIDFKMYCYVVRGDDSLPYYDWNTQFVYSFVETDDVWELEGQAAYFACGEKGEWDNWGEHFGGNRASCLNELVRSADTIENAVDLHVLERYPDGDINMLAEYTYGIKYPHRKFSKIYGRRYKDSRGMDVYFWSHNWKRDGYRVYTSGHTIPDDLSTITVYDGTVADVEENFTLVQKRNDLNCFCIGVPDSDDGTTYEELVDRQTMFEELYEQCITCPNQSHERENVRNPDKAQVWPVYWFDYPIKPLRLGECYIKIPIEPVCDPEERDNYPYQGEWVRVNKFFEEYQDVFWEYMPIDLVQFRLPYETDYLWLRFCGWQKACYYGNFDEEYPDEKIPFGLKNCLGLSCPYMHKMDDGEGGYWELRYDFYLQPGFGRKQRYNSIMAGRTNEWLQFYIASDKEINNCQIGQTKRVQKKLTIIQDNGVQNLI